MRRPVSSVSRTFWTVARAMNDHELYVDTREAFQYDSANAAMIDADSRNIVLQTTMAAGNPVSNPGAKFMAVKVTRSEIIERA